MRLHQLPAIPGTKQRKRVGRGGKRGTFSGRGSKGQKSRAGHRIRPGFRGGDNPIWKLFPKQRGASKKTDIKHGLFQPRRPRPAVVSVGALNTRFADGQRITASALVKKGLIRTAQQGVKILSGGAVNKKFDIVKLNISAPAREQITRAGGTVQ